MRSMPRPENLIAFYLGGIPYSFKDLGDDLLDEDLRTVFQTMIDRDMVPGVPPGSPWYKHIRMDRLEKVNQEFKEGDLHTALVKDRTVAEEAYLESGSEEDRQRAMEADKRVRMARKLVSD